jgi:serine/threonine-protein kinase
LPQNLPGYRLVHELGRGAMGIVYLAIDRDGQPVAVKTIVPAVAAGPKAVARFLREADILRSIHHPRIVAFRELGEVSGTLFLAMEYVAGLDAARLLKKEGPLSVERAVRWACQLLDALDYAHARKFVHRDVKPANLLVTGTPGKEEVCLTDFGLARVYQASRLSGLTMTGEVSGTPAFMAPEQVTNFREATPPVDQYAAAATLYYLLTGEYVFDNVHAQHEVFVRLMDGQVVPIRERRPEIPEPLARIIHRALASEPAKRFADVAQFQKVLAHYTAGGG